MLPSGCSVETGILTREDHVELIHGEIVQMAPMGRPHHAAVAALHALLVQRLGTRVVVFSQGSLPLPPRSMPEPDVLVVKPRLDFYRAVEIQPSDVILLVEVAEPSLRDDHPVKVPLHAEARIQEVWVVDVEGDAVETCREPTRAGYGRVERFAHGATFAPEAFPDLALTVTDILG